jgi:hypothetical protein
MESGGELSQSVLRRLSSRITCGVGGITIDPKSFLRDSRALRSLKHNKILEALSNLKKASAASRRPKLCNSDTLKHSKDEANKNGQKRPLYNGWGRMQNGAITSVPYSFETLKESGLGDISDARGYATDRKGAIPIPERCRKPLR